MHWKISALLSLIFILSLFMSACSNGEELLIGSYQSGDEIVFDEEKTIKDPDTINEFKTIIHESAISEEQASTEGYPNRVIHINNWDNSTMVMMVYLWFENNSTITFRRGIEEDQYYSVSEKDSERIKELLRLDEAE
jgi:hypothetical protein